MSDTIGMGWRFVRSFIGGPFAGTVFLAREHARVITVADRDFSVGRYVLCNLGWTWHEAQS